jgi:uncharacterized membrane protein YkvA (DUF1232 family)
MTFTNLWKVLAETSLSPELLAPEFGIGSMTLRRWKKLPGTKEIPRAYQQTIVEGVYRLIQQGKLRAESKTVQTLLLSSTSLSFEAIMKSLGASDVLENGNGSSPSPHSPESNDTNPQENLSVALSRIGMSSERRAEVDSSEKKLGTYFKLGSEWQTRISTLWQVISSKKLDLTDKLVAYGALFYLIFPLDLIPDHIPVIGLLDDYGVLGIAVGYYLKKYAGEV